MEMRSFEIRATGTQDQPVLEGYAVVYGVPSEPLPFTERIRAGAFKACLDKNPDIPALVGHDMGRVVARTANGTLKLTDDEHGLKVTILPNMDTTDGRDLVASVARRDLTRMSFGFEVRAEEWAMGDNGQPIREVTEADLYEVSVVALPAYPQTEISKRDQTGGKTTMESTNANTMETRTVPETKVNVPEAAIPAAVDEQRAAFQTYIRTGERRALGVSTEAAGGVMAPTAFVAEVLRKRQEVSVMRRVARIIGPINGTQVDIPRNLTGVTASWLAENTAITASDPTFDKLTFVPHKFGALTVVSNELLADGGVDVEALLSQLFGEALGKLEDQAFFSGNGNGQPKGILADASIETVTAAAAAGVAIDDILSLYDAVPPQYRDSAAWIMNPATMSALRKLKDTAGRLMLTSDLTGPAPVTLLGRPVLLSSNMPTVAANAKSILFGDFAAGYIIVDRAGLDVQRSTDRYFELDQTAFRALARTDGQVAIADAVRVLVHPAA